MDDKEEGKPTNRVRIHVTIQKWKKAMMTMMMSAMENKLEL